jgi:F1F0 ATPase subunit 2
MSGFRVTEHEMVMLVANASAWLAIGALLGAFHYLTLRRNAQMLVTGSSVLKLVTLQLIRFAVMAGVLVIVTRDYGALPLLVAMLGVLVSRTAVLHLGASI